MFYHSLQAPIWSTPTTLVKQHFSLATQDSSMSSTFLPQGFCTWRQIKDGHKFSDVPSMKRQKWVLCFPLNLGGPYHCFDQQSMIEVMLFQPGRSGLKKLSCSTSFLENSPLETWVTLWRDPESTPLERTQRSPLVTWPSWFQPSGHPSQGTKLGSRAVSDLA